jgi:hypothetical protein
MKKILISLLLTLLLSGVALGQFKPRIITEDDILKFISLPNIMLRLEILNDAEKEEELLAKEGLGTEESLYIISKIGINYTWMYIRVPDNSTGNDIDNITKDREFYFKTNPQYILTAEERALIEKHKDALELPMKKIYGY